MRICETLRKINPSTLTEAVFFFFFFKLSGKFLQFSHTFMWISNVQIVHIWRLESTLQNIQFLICISQHPKSKYQQVCFISPFCQHHQLKFHFGRRCCGTKSCVHSLSHPAATKWFNIISSPLNLIKKLNYVYALRPRRQSAETKRPIKW
jgi:hypothetical protein